MSSKTKLSTGLLVGVIALLCLCGYLWYSNSQLKSQLKTNTTEMAELQKIQEELDKDYQRSLESIESMRDENKNLDELINSQKSELKAQKKKIDGLIWSTRELDKAKEEIGKFQNITSGYLSQINDLKADNERLSNSNLALRDEKEKLSVNLLEEKSLTETLTAQTNTLTEVKNELEEKAVVLNTKVNIGSAIKINFMEVKGYQLKDDNSLKKKRKAKNIDVLRICFKTETNMVTASGEEVFQIRYIDEAGNTVVGTGDQKVLTNEWDGTEVMYSTEGTIEYNNEDTEGCMDWVIGTKLSKGKYTVQMYNKGYLVGNGDFKLR